MKKIIGIGNALTDKLIRLNTDQTLSEFGLPKGGMQIIDTEKYSEISWYIEGFESQTVPGGSACNTIRGIAELGGDTAFVGMTGNDATGDFFENDLKKSGVDTKLFRCSTPSGTALTFISPDGERTFATHLGAAVRMSAEMISEDVFNGCGILHLEGYLLQNRELITKAVQLAKVCGLQISLDLASYNVVLENLNFLQDFVKDYIDILFANEEEAKAFTGLDDARDALYLMAEICRIGIVKVGQKGSYVKRGKEPTIHVGISPHNCIDTTGAGDFYAAGLLYGLANDFSLEKSAEIAKILSGNIISVVGVKMNDSQWTDIKNEIAML